jgi:hypothetical protein
LENFQKCEELFERGETDAIFFDMEPMRAIWKGGSIKGVESAEVGFVPLEQLDAAIAFPEAKVRAGFSCCNSHPLSTLVLPPPPTVQHHIDIEISASEFNYHLRKWREENGVFAASLREQFFGSSSDEVFDVDTRIDW